MAGNSKLRALPVYVSQSDGTRFLQLCASRGDLREAVLVYESCLFMQAGTLKLDNFMDAERGLLRFLSLPALLQCTMLLYVYNRRYHSTM